MSDHETSNGFTCMRIRYPEEYVLTVTWEQMKAISFALNNISLEMDDKDKVINENLCKQLNKHGF